MKSNLNILCILGAMFVFSFVEELSGCWTDIPLEEIVQNSPVVVVGKIDKVDCAEPPKDNTEYKYDIAYITVSNVLKNALKDIKINIGDKIPLRMPSINNKVHISKDIYYHINQEGIWILEYKEKFYLATYPKDYQSLEEAEEIQDIILRQKN